MRFVAIRAGFVAASGTEEALTEYRGDGPGRPNIPVHLSGCVRELRALAGMCAVHPQASLVGRT